MTMQPPEIPAGIEAIYLANRDKLVRFLRARGAGDHAEDLLHDLWVKLQATRVGPIGNPLAYLFRAADMLMIDRHRAETKSALRDQAWSETEHLPASSEREIAARQEAAQVVAVLASLGARRETVFRRSRIDGVPQRQIAAELNISVSTVESDLRTACQALAELKERMR